MDCDQHIFLGVYRRNGYAFHRGRSHGVPVARAGGLLEDPPAHQVSRSFFDRSLFVKKNVPLISSRVNEVGLGGGSVRECWKIHRRIRSIGWLVVFRSVTLFVKENVPSTSNRGKRWDWEGEVLATFFGCCSLWWVLDVFVV